MATTKTGTSSVSTPGTIEVRPATAEDHGPLVDLVLQAWDAQAVAEGLDPKSRPSQRRVRATLVDAGEDGRRSLLLAVEDGTIVGFGEMWVLPDLFVGGEVALLRTLYVDPRLREQGVGTVLVERLLEVAHARDARTVRVTSSIDNVEGLSFFQRRGLRSTGLVLTRNL